MEKQQQEHLASMLRSDDIEVRDLAKVILRNELKSADEVDHFNEYIFENYDINEKDKISTVFIPRFARMNSSVLGVKVEYLHNDVEVNIL